MNPSRSTEERIWAVLAHLSALALGAGILLPIVGWSEQRQKSKYAAFQSLQALGYQSLGYTIWVLTTLVVIIVSGLIALAGLNQAQDIESEMMGVLLAHTAITFVMFGVYFLLPILAAVSCALGRDFHYPIMGRRLARYLGYQATPGGDEPDVLIEEHEDRWVASMGHFAVLILLWGMLAPLTAWILQGSRGAFLKFQSVQTIAYQAGVLLLSALGLALYFFGALFLLMSLGGSGASLLDSPLGLTGIVVSFGSLLCAALILLIVPFFHILGQWAGYRTLKGDDYRYPLLGNLVHSFMSVRGVEMPPIREKDA